MAELKTTAMQGAGGALGARAATISASERVLRKRGPAPVEERRTPVFENDGPRGVERAVAALVEPPASAATWLHDPSLSKVLREASDALAPNGAARDPADRYAASVIETHLAARKRLAKHVNALIKT